MRRSDFLVIGGGIVGLATAYAYLQRFAGESVVIVEKNPTLRSTSLVEIRAFSTRASTIKQAAEKHVCVSRVGRRY